MHDLIEALKEVIAPGEILFISPFYIVAGYFDKDYKWHFVYYYSKRVFVNSLGKDPIDFKRDVVFNRYPKICSVLNKYINSGDIPIKEPNVDYACAKLNSRDGLEEFIDLCTKKRERINGWMCSTDLVDRHIGKIQNIYTYRTPENPNEKTFDFIKAETCILGIEDKIGFVKEHKKGICQKVLSKIEGSREFKRYCACEYFKTYRTYLK